MIRVVPEFIPVDVDRYLLPGEVHIVTVRRHPVVLAPAFFLLVANAAAFVLSALGVISGGAAVLAVLGILIPLSSYILYRSRRLWSRAYVVITRARIMLVNLRRRHSLVVIPLTETSDMTLTRIRPFGRGVGCGSFLIKNAGFQGRPLKIRYLPYPDQLYLEVSGYLFPNGQDARATRSRSAK